METNFLYGFLLGMNVGRFTNLFSTVVVSGIALYIHDPNVYNYENLSSVANTTMTLIKSFR